MIDPSVNVTNQTTIPQQKRQPAAEKKNAASVQRYRNGTGGLPADEHVVVTGILLPAVVRDHLVVRTHTGQQIELFSR